MNDEIQRDEIQPEKIRPSRGHVLNFRLEKGCGLFDTLKSL